MNDQLYDGSFRSAAFEDSTREINDEDMTIDYSRVRTVDIQNATIYESEYVNES